MSAIFRIMSCTWIQQNDREGLIARLVAFGRGLGALGCAGQNECFVIDV